MPISGITADNLLKKLCFVHLGHWTIENQTRLKSSLFAFWKQHEYNKNPTISRQTILYWFERNSVPKRIAAQLFIKRYFESNVVRDEDKSREQKKVYDQIEAFFKKIPDKIIEGALSDNLDSRVESISLSRRHRVIVEIQQSIDEIKRLESKLVGLYRLYHARLVYDPDYPVSQEAMEVFMRGAEIRFRIWYNIDVKHISTMEGIVFIAGSSLWFIGVSTEGKNRIRTITVRNIDSINDVYNTIMWGIMTTDIPQPSAPDPVSSRVVIWKEKSSRIKDIETFTQKNVRLLTLDETKKEPVKSLMRLINNRITASSEGETGNPSKKNGLEIVDNVMRVNQQTLENVIRKLAGMLRG